ncbi:MAG TPA: serine hydrolase [Longimicrobiaceae bacterium]|nr:serine hydrolase [Longimicrobiaceae bacterium]
MGSTEPSAGELPTRIKAIENDSGAETVAVAYYDYQTKTGWDYNGDEWFHAASTIKVPVLVGVFGAIEAGTITENSRVHVRNRFLSAADGEPYRIESGRDANSAVHSARGKTMKVGDLAYHMITTSSNLATNLLIDLVGLERMKDTLAELGADGIQLARGVEDERAFEEGISNRVTAKGLLHVLRLVEEGQAFPEPLSKRMLEILHGQEFRGGIPAGLPDDARVAHKTGEISTVAHDAGLVYLPDREPYGVAILTRWAADGPSGRSATIARLSRAVFEHLTCAEGDDE